MRHLYLIPIFSAAALLAFAGCASAPLPAPAPKSEASPAVDTSAPAPVALATPVGPLLYLSKYADPAAAASAQWMVVPAKTGNLEFRIYDEGGRVVRVSTRPARSGDSVRVAWDGKDSAGGALPSDAYYLRITLRDSLDSAVYDPRWTTGGEVITARDAVTQALDSGRFQVDFYLAKDSRTNLNFGILAGALLHHPVWMKAMPAGKRRFVWKGSQNRDSLDFGKFHNLVHTVTGYSLSENALLVLSGSDPDFAALAMEKPPIARLLRPVATQARHPIGDILPPRFSIRIKNPLGLAPDGTPKISGKVQVEVIMDDAERLRVMSQRFEMMFFSDFFAIFEDEEAAVPFTFTWDVSAYKAGTHYLTCNIDTYAQASAARTLPVTIVESKDKK
ncbi:MAG: hypothetical protein JWP91_3932 [Fibrobacteres bacterium]|nr:hypothetical protein [Fibrobacterota bacterium]